MCLSPFFLLRLESFRQIGEIARDFLDRFVLGEDSTGIVIQFVSLRDDVVAELDHLNKVACQAQCGQRIKHVSRVSCCSIASRRDGRSKLTSWAKEDDLPAPGTLHSQPYAAILQAWTKVGGCAVCVLFWADCTTFQWLSLDCSAFVPPVATRDI
jgi:hypothetical protein